MSTLVTQNISNGTVSTSSANVIQGSAKAWVNFNGTGTVAIRASYNVSSITDNGTGNYSVNFTNAMSDTNYCVCSSQFGYDQPSSTVASNSAFLIVSASEVKMLTTGYTNSAFDMSSVTVAVFR